jgi:hypothetical protein
VPQPRLEDHEELRHARTVRRGGTAGWVFA